jgi:hypothetical protein
MNAIFGILLQGASAFILTASAQSPAAVVEEIQGGVPGIQFMDYVDPGQVIRLGAHDRIVLRLFEVVLARNHQRRNGDGRA